MSVTVTTYTLETFRERAIVGSCSISFGQVDAKPFHVSFGFAYGKVAITLIWMKVIMARAAHGL